MCWESVLESVLLALLFGICVYVIWELHMCIFCLGISCGGFCMYVFGGFCKGLDVPCCFYKTSMLELMEVSPFSLIEIACIFLFMIFPVGR